MIDMDDGYFFRMDRQQGKMPVAAGNRKLPLNVSWTLRENGETLPRINADREVMAKACHGIGVTEIPWSFVSLTRFA
jgi:hypothetical protein